MSNEYPAPRDSHGRTPAAWATVSIMLFAFVVGTFGVVIAQIWLLYLAIGILIAGAIVGKVMSAMGLGQYPRNTGETANEAS